MQTQEIQFISELSCYKLKSIFFRVSMVSAVALAFMSLSKYLVVDKSIDIPTIQFLRVIIIFNIISESNVLLDNLSERFFPIPSKIKTRVVLHFILSLFIGFIAMIYFSRTITDVDLLNQPITWLMFAFGFIFIFILIVIAVSLRITTKWTESRREVEDLKQMQLKNDYNALQDQLNPHFLFNNLSVLKSLIQYAPNTAIEFTQNFTDTYRYVLQSKDKTTVPLSEELQFIHSYMGLHKERLGEGLIVTFNIDKELMPRNIPPLSLQLLIENAIKHNIASKEEPLSLLIAANNEQIWVENNLQPKDSSYSTHKGLRNLIARYAYLTEKEVVITQTDRLYRVELPLL
jgi:two-component system, LytTR family, sensor kinase